MSVNSGFDVLGNRNLRIEERLDLFHTWFAHQLLLREVE